MARARPSSRRRRVRLQSFCALRRTSRLRPHTRGGPLASSHMPGGRRRRCSASSSRLRAHAQSCIIKSAMLDHSPNARGTGARSMRCTAAAAPPPLRSELDGTHSHALVGTSFTATMHILTVGGLEGPPPGLEAPPRWGAGGLGGWSRAAARLDHSASIACAELARRSCCRPHPVHRQWSARACSQCQTQVGRAPAGGGAGHGASRLSAIPCLHCAAMHWQCARPLATFFSPLPRPRLQLRRWAGSAASSACCSSPSCSSSSRSCWPPCLRWTASSTRATLRL